MNALFHIDINSTVPLYEQLKQQIIELQLLELLKAGDALPSVRTLARDLGINPNTVSKAYGELEQQGVIYSIAGKGCYVEERNEIVSSYKEQKLTSFKELYLSFFTAIDQEINFIRIQCIGSYTEEKTLNL